jgi:glycosyltransferase involved in cell wall biosynthesis
MTRPPLAVVVPTRDRPELLARCLAALQADAAAGDEVIVVDSASSAAGEVAEVTARGGARLVRCDEKGASRARNAGWRSTSLRLVAFVDDDMQVLPGWSDALVAAAQGPSVVFVAGRTVAPEGSEGELATVTWGRPDDVIDRRTRGVFAASNNLLVRRSALVRTGGFDQRLGPGTWLEAGEDLELLDRLMADGGQGRYAHEAVATHEQWRDPAQRRRLQLSYGKGMGARFASLLRHDRRRAREQAPELLRLGGLSTLARRARREKVPAAAPGDRPAGPEDVSGVVGPLLWRCGALVGLVVGLWVLRPGPGAPSGVQVPVDD